MTSVNGVVYLADNLPVLRELPDASVHLIYIDPPFNTGQNQKRTQVKVQRASTGKRVGFNGQRYRTTVIGTQVYPDAFDDYIEGFLRPRLEQAYRVLSEDGTLYFHIDYRESHYCKIMLDIIFGRTSFLNEVIWAYDYGGKSKTRWPPKHDSILVYVKDPDNYTFNVEAIDRIPYMTPGLVTPDKLAQGKLPTDTWWHSIVGTSSKEKTGYPTQKPLGIINRIVLASSNPGDTVLDFFAGSGTVGESCIRHGRNFILVDSNPTAVETMHRRLAQLPGARIEWRNWSSNGHSDLLP